MKKALLIFLVSSVVFAVPQYSHLSVEGVRPVRLKRGATSQAVVELKVRQGFHVQANPASKPQLIATKVDVATPLDLSAERPIYPTAKPYKVPGLQTDVDTYDGQFEVKIPLKAAASAAMGKREIEGKVRYQACDDKVCYPPTVAKFGVPVEIVP